MLFAVSCSHPRDGRRSRGLTRSAEAYAGRTASRGGSALRALRVSEARDGAVGTTTATGYMTASTTLVVVATAVWVPDGL